MIKALAEQVVQWMLGKAVRSMMDGFDDPDGWEADPATRKIRRKKRPRQHIRAEVFDVCPFCHFTMVSHGPGGQCPATPKN